MNEKGAVIVIGKKWSGKTTFGMAFAKHLSLKFCDSSDVLRKIENKRREVLNGFREQHGTQTQIDFTDPETKELYRAFLISMGDAICDSDPAFMVRHAFERECCQVIAGVRRRAELQVAKDAGLVSRVYWIERPGSDGRGVDNLDLTHADADQVVVNDSDDDECEQLKQHAGIYAGIWDSSQ